MCVFTESMKIAINNRFLTKGNLRFRALWWIASICRADIAICRYGHSPISTLRPVSLHRANEAGFLWWESHICVETWQTFVYRRSQPCVLEYFPSDLNIPPRSRKIVWLLSYSVCNSSPRGYRISDSTALKLFKKSQLWVSAGFIWLKLSRRSI